MATKSILDRIETLEHRINQLPLFSIADLQLLAISIASWQEASGADGTAVSVELQRLIDEMCVTMTSIA